MSSWSWFILWNRREFLDSAVAPPAVLGSLGPPTTCDCTTQAWEDMDPAKTAYTCQSCQNDLVLLQKENVGERLSSSLSDPVVVFWGCLWNPWRRVGSCWDAQRGYRLEGLSFSFQKFFILCEKTRQPLTSCTRFWTLLPKLVSFWTVPTLTLSFKKCSKIDNPPSLHKTKLRILERMVSSQPSAAISRESQTPGNIFTTNSTPKHWSVHKQKHKHKQTKHRIKHQKIYKLELRFLSKPLHSRSPFAGLRPLTVAPDLPPMVPTAAWMSTADWMSSFYFRFVDEFGGGGRFLK